MASYRLLIKTSAVKELEAPALKDRRRVAARLRSLSGQPRPSGSEKLSGHDLHRVRQGDYRILHQLSDQERTVTIIKIGHRREIYR